MQGMFELSSIPIPDRQEHQARYKSGHTYRSVPDAVPNERLPVQETCHTIEERKKDDDLCKEETQAQESPPQSSSLQLQQPPLTTQSLSTLPQSFTEEGSVDSFCPTSPQFKYCSFCERQVLTVVEFEPSKWAYLGSVVLFLCFGFLSICVIPFVYPLLQVAKHHCPLCGDVLEKKRRLSCSVLRDEVVTLRVGSCALVLSRKYLIGCGVMASFLIVLLSIRWYVNAFGLPDLPRGEPVSKSWEDFLADCGGHSFLGNPVRARRKFEDEYFERTVRWTGGRMHNIKESLFGKHLMFLDMEPRQYSRSDFRDLVLIFGKGLHGKVMNVEVGDRLSFEATLIELGKRGHPHLGLLWDFNVTAKAADLPKPNELQYQFVVLRNHLTSPLDIILQGLQMATQRKDGKQEGGTDVAISLPFDEDEDEDGGGSPVIKLIPEEGLGENENQQD